MTRKKIILTGSSGFIGSHLEVKLNEEGHEIFGIDRIPPRQMAKGRHLTGSIFDIAWEDILAWKPDIIIHTAGPASVRQSYSEPYREAIDGLGATAFLLEKLRLHPGSTFIFFSTAGVYGDQFQETYAETLPLQPLSPYAIGKSACEQFIRCEAEQHGLRYVILRPFSVYGPGLKKQVVYDLSRRFLAREEPMKIEGTGREKRDFVHIADCCEVVAKLICSDLPQTLTLNIGTGRATELAQLAAIIAKRAKYSLPITFSGRDFPGNPHNLVADVTRMTEYGVRCPIDVESGIPQVLQTLHRDI